MNNKLLYMLKTTDYLYKYTAIEYIPSSLAYGIYAGCVEDLNDPYEAKDINKPDLYRVCALSLSRNSNLMWAHYARSHKGCTLQIKRSEYDRLNSALKRVEYKNRYINRQNLVDESEIVDSLYSKDKKWKNEYEVRAVFCKSIYDPSIWYISKDGKVFLKATISTINFGCMADTHSQEYKDSVNAIYQYNQNANTNNKIKVQKMMMKNDEYRFIIDRSYLFESELKRLGIIKDLALAGK